MVVRKRKEGVYRNEIDQMILEANLTYRQVQEAAGITQNKLLALRRSNTFSKKERMMIERAIHELTGIHPVIAKKEYVDDELAERIAQKVMDKFAGALLNLA